MTKVDVLKIYLGKPNCKVENNISDHFIIIDGTVYMIFSEEEGDYWLHQYQEYEIEDIKDRLEFKKERKLFDFIDWNKYFLGSSLEDYGFSKQEIKNSIFYISKI